MSEFLEAELLAELDAQQRERMAELWRQGAPSLGLADAQQAGWLERLRAADGDVVICASRQVGKTFCVVLFLVEQCHTKPGFIARFASKTAKSMGAILGPLMAQILADCPEELRPRHNEQKGFYVWPNGSTLTYAGLDSDNQDKLRGPRAHVIAYTEAGFIQDLPGAEAALGPQLQTTGGISIYESSHSESDAHPFEDRVRAAEGTGRCIKANIYDNPRLTPAEVETILRKEAEKRGLSVEEFKGTTYCRREFFNEKVAEESRVAIPSWPGVAIECTREYERPAFFHGYTGHDWGGYENDPHAALFGFVDFKAAKLIIEDEDEIRGITLGQLADRWKGKEVALWGERSWDGTLWGAGEFERATKFIPDFLKPALANSKSAQPFLRVADHNEQLQGDLMRIYGYALLPTAKPDKHLWVDDLNQGIHEKRVIVHPRCRRLLEQLRTTLWDDKRRQWIRTEKDHGDLIDCFVAGTKIRTAHGETPVELLRVGDEVWTRAGLRKVIAAKQTKRRAEIWRLTTTSGVVLEGTGDHPVWTQDGWVRLRELTDGSPALLTFARTPIRVASVIRTGREACVFNLAVADDPEYFANGILVHNCLVYLWRNIFWNVSPFPPEAPQYWGAPPPKTGFESVAAAMTGRKRR